MAYPIMSAIPISMAKGLKKTPNFNSVGQKTAAAMGNSFASLKPYATWDFELDMDHITGNEANANSVIASFMGVYMACQGQANLFLFTDPQDNFVSAMQFGAGDGSTTAFQLSRGIGGATDIIQNVNGSIQVFLNGALTTAYSVSSTGIVTFTSAPAVATVITWTGSFYFLCRFSEDMLDSVRSFTVTNGVDQWDVSSIKFSSEFVGANSSGVVFAGGGSFGTFLTGTPLAVLLNPTGAQSILSYPLNVVGLSSETANIATSGFICMANTDTIDWRNAANTGNLALGVNSSNQLTFNGSVIGSCMVYPGAGIPNSTGSAWGTSYTTTGSGTVVALATSPTFVTPILGTPTSGNLANCTFPTLNQNTTGTAAGLTGSPSITVTGLTATTINGAAFSGTFTGAPTFSGNISFTGTPTFSNALALGSSTATTQTAGDSTTKIATTSFVATSFAPLASPTFTGTATFAALSCSGAINFTGASISLGTTGSGVTIGGTGSSLTVGGTGAATTITGSTFNITKVTTYNSITTAGNGVASDIFQTLNASLTANFNSGSAKTLFTPTAAAMYRISYFQAIKTAATTSSTFPSLTLGYTDAGGVSRTLVLVATSSTNTTAVLTQGSTVIYTNGSTAVTITSASYTSSGATAMAYELAVTAEAI